MRSALIASAVAVLAAGTATAVTSGDPGADQSGSPALGAGQPRVEVLTPRNGSRHGNGSAIVRVEVENFQLAPARLGDQPRLGEGHLRFSLNRVPDCVTPEQIEQARNDPRGSGRITGASFDHPEHSGANGLLAREIGTEGSYSPATVPKILYADLNPGFYRLVVALARNNGTTLPAHDVTTFEILPLFADGDEAVGQEQTAPYSPECKPGTVPTLETRDELE